MSYELIDTIGSGGMARVHLARLAHEPNTPVAVKVLHPHLSDDADAVAMFLDEARVATQIQHPNVVAVSDVDMVANELVILMEYVEGIALSGLLRALRDANEQMPIDAVIRVVVGLLRGLHAAHELVDENGEPMRIVHRDVSPHNVLVGMDGVARVTDFGVATSVGRLAQTRTDGVVRGKLQYLAPEQIQRKKPDRRMDIWSAGVVLWECLTGKRLWGGGTEAETLSRILRDPIDPPSTHRPDIPMGLDDICLRALERDPDRRYATAEDFASDLVAEARSDGLAEVRRLVEATSGEEIRHRRMVFARGVPSSKEPRISIGPPAIDVDAPTVAVDFFPSVTGPVEVPTKKSVLPVPAPPRARSNFVLLAVVAGVSLLIGGVAVKLTTAKNEPLPAPTATMPPPTEALTVATTPSSAPNVIELGATPSGSTPPPRRANDRRKLQPSRPASADAGTLYMPPGL